ncbi:MAG TPA: MFS transporter [Blastocatellia bacterium]|nr:MFS transporter [Blastocatellia bacterium]
MTDSGFKVYPYRWVVLAVFMLVNLTVQILWIAYAPITGPAAKYYGVSDLRIGLLAMMFMIVFIPISIPVAWAIDTWGFHVAVSVGAILIGVCATLRGLAGANYTWALIGTIGIASGQPFLMNAWTKLPANWFPMRERATAVGLAVLSGLVGTGLGLALTPQLIEHTSIAKVQLMYGAVALVFALLFVLFARDQAPTPPCPPDMHERALMLDGLKHALRIRSFWVYLLVWFVGMGIFNGVTTWVENIVRPRGFSPAQAGELGGLMLVGGILGALIFPPISDRFRTRRPFLAVGLLLTIPGLAGLAFTSSYSVLVASVMLLGFFLVSTGPIGMQYAAEITHPTPEGTSAGIIQLVGQLSVVFVYLMDAMKRPDGSFTPSLVLGIGLLVAGGLAVSQLKDARLVINLGTDERAPASEQVRVLSKE